MANRHSHKKLRTEARARKARTGESYQQARQRLLDLTSSFSSSPQACSGFNVLEFRCFGKPAVLASWHSFGIPIAMVLAEARRPLMFPRFVLESTTDRSLGGSK